MARAEYQALPPQKWSAAHLAHGVVPGLKGVGADTNPAADGMTRECGRTGWARSMEQGGASCWRGAVQAAVLHFRWPAALFVGGTCPCHWLPAAPSHQGAAGIKALQAASGSAALLLAQQHASRTPPSTPPAPRHPAPHTRLPIHRAELFGGEAAHANAHGLGRQRDEVGQAAVAVALPAELCICRGEGDQGVTWPRAGRWARRRLCWVGGLPAPVRLTPTSGPCLTGEGAAIHPKGDVAAGQERLVCG